MDDWNLSTFIKGNQNYSPIIWNLEKQSQLPLLLPTNNKQSKPNTGQIKKSREGR